MDITLVDIIGYAAMITLVISFMIANLRTLRLVNTVGCILFIIYGFLLTPFAWPVIITNVFITGVNIYYLFFKKG